MSTHEPNPATVSLMQRLRRVWRHRWIDERRLTASLDAAALQRLQDAVAASERLHSGEIRLCVEVALPLSLLWQPLPMQVLQRQRALQVFGELGVWDTEHNNGVLIYLLLAERAIEVVADRGLQRHTGDAFWQGEVARLVQALRAGQFESGLRALIDAVTAVLAREFPLSAGAANPNELPDAPDLR